MNVKLKIYLSFVYITFSVLLISLSIINFTSFPEEVAFLFIAVSLAILLKFINSDAIKDLQSTVHFYMVLPIIMPSFFYLPPHYSMFCVALSSFLMAKKEIALYKRFFTLSAWGLTTYFVSSLIHLIITDIESVLFNPETFLIILLSGLLWNIVSSLFIYVAASLEKGYFDTDTLLAMLSSLRSAIGTLFLGVINIVVFAYASVIGVAITSFVFVFVKPALTYHQIFQNELIAYTHFVLGLLKKKDPVTHLHSERVKYWTVMLAKQMKLSKQEIRDLSLAASWHDIGKIDIPEGLLTKPGKLTQEEFNIIKQHPEVGYNMVKDIHFFKKYLPVIRHHHEAYDGSGYPLGLKENEINLHARMMCITDSFDAMTADRPYRTGMHMREAVAELNRCKGKQFDPKLVDHFIEALRKNFGKDFEKWDTEKEKILSA